MHRAVCKTNGSVGESTMACNFISLKHIFRGVYARVGNHEYSFLVVSENRRKGLQCIISWLGLTQFVNKGQRRMKRTTQKGQTHFYFIGRAIVTPVKGVCLNDNKQPRPNVKIYAVWITNHQSIVMGKRYMDINLIFSFHVAFLLQK